MCKTVKIEYDDGSGRIVSSHDISDQPYVWNMTKSVGTYTIKITNDLGYEDTTSFSVT